MSKGEARSRTTAPPTIAGRPDDQTCGHRVAANRKTRQVCASTCLRIPQDVRASPSGGRRWDFVRETATDCGKSALRHERRVPAPLQSLWTYQKRNCGPHAIAAAGSQEEELSTRAFTRGCLDTSIRQFLSAVSQKTFRVGVQHE
jgi:hypothetical protein